MAEKITITSDQVVSRKGGWVTYIDARASARKVRSSQVIVVDEGALNTPAVITYGDTSIPAVPPQVVDDAPDSVGSPPKLSGDDDMATAKKKSKSTASGSRTIGGKSVDLTRYKKDRAPGGGLSYNNGDDVAGKLSGKSMDEVYAIVARGVKLEESDLRKRFKHLNLGMQRMNLGNMLRKGPRDAKPVKSKKSA